jgi:hypothetical protein
MEYKCRATLSYDQEKEKDIADKLESLSSRHKLGDFLSNLVRITFENPNELAKLGLRIDNYGLSDDRRQFFDDVTKQVNEMNQKVDKIYDMAVKTYSLAQFGKKMGLEQKSINLLQTQFVIQKQISELCSILGVSNLGHTFESNKMYNVAKDVDETLEFIINYYDGIVKEIQDNIDIAPQQAKGSVDGSNIVKEDKSNSESHTDNDKGLIVVANNEEEEDKAIDFGTGADLELLNNFFG